MSKQKTSQEIEVLREGGRILARILRELGEWVRPGVSTREIDVAAEKKIRAAGGIPSFKGYGDPPFPGTICASVNEELVHGIPNEKKILKEGDIFTIDIGMRYPAKGGFYTDHAKTFAVGRIPSETENLLRVTEEALKKGIRAAQLGNFIHDISKAIEAHVLLHGFFIVREYVGHGVGHAVHEDPRIPNYYDPREPKVVLKEGMVLAIEPMVNMGSPEVRVGEDGWTVVSRDGKPNAHFEHTIAITKKGPEILTA